MAQPLRVKIPIAVVIEAFPHAIARAKAVGSDDHDADSPGGAKVTAGEAAEDIAAFFAVLAEEILPAILEANGLG